MGLGVTAWSPLAGGVLSGKYAGVKAEPDARMNSEMMKAFSRDNERTRAVIAEVQAVAGQVGKSPAQVALGWLRHRPIPVIPIIGARRLAQLQDNLSCLDLKLDASQLERLDSISQIEPGFPHEFYTRDLVKDLVYGGLRDKLDV